MVGRIVGKDRPGTDGGNDIADKEAKKALKEVLRSSPTAAYNAHWAMGCGVGHLDRCMLG